MIDRLLEEVRREPRAAVERLRTLVDRLELLAVRVGFDMSVEDLQRALRLTINRFYEELADDGIEYVGARTGRGEGNRGRMEGGLRGPADG